MHPPLAQSNGADNVPSNDSQAGAATGLTSFDRHEIELLRTLLAEKDARIADRDDQIADLRRRLDQAAGLLTDQRPTS